MILKVAYLSFVSRAEDTGSAYLSYIDENGMIDDRDMEAMHCNRFI